MYTNVSNVTFPPLGPSSARMVKSASAEPRVEVMFIIFSASLFAASFPTLSKQIPILRIPPVVFFIGKHFGTGVILATAFIHLMDDAFRSLQNPLVIIRYGNIGKWTGLIILASLLVIFLVEYVSTSYVDYLQAKPSAPPTPIGSVPPSRPASLKPLSRSISYENLPPSTISRQPQQNISTKVQLSLPTPNTCLTETTPLLPSTHPITDTSLSLPYLTNKSLHSRDHSPHRYHHHHVNHIYTPVTPSVVVTGLPIDVRNSPRIFRQLGLGRSHAHGDIGPEQANEGESPDHIHHHHVHVPEHHPRVGRRRQIVGLLVLQLGIMIHSLVIGLTLAITDGSDFTSLTTAILFHQLFEGLSLGIRIASLPPKDIASHMTVEDEEGLFSTQPLLPPTCYVPPITRDHDSDAGASSNSTSLPRHSCVTENSNPEMSGEGVELHPRNSYLWTFREVRWLKPTLSFLFAVTTPFGMGVGMRLWKERDGSDTTQMLLIQGTMSAISAGMLIYVGTVEMIAGDFVFGDPDGGHGHGHVHHYHPHPDPQGSGRSDSRCRFNNHDDQQPHMPGQPEGDCDDGKQHREEPSGMKVATTKKVLAVVSLFAGAAGMVLIGLGE